jgi:hypothetical protein
VTQNDILGLAELFRLSAKNKPIVRELVAVLLSPEDCRAVSDLLLSIHKKEPHKCA